MEIIDRAGTGSTLPKAIELRRHGRLSRLLVGLDVLKHSPGIVVEILSRWGVWAIFAINAVTAMPDVGGEMVVVVSWWGEVTTFKILSDLRFVVANNLIMFCIVISGVVGRTQRRQSAVDRTVASTVKSKWERFGRCSTWAQATLSRVMIRAEQG